ncbi:hypothetical protein [Streptomyces sp. F-1]|nr:hypothetical protein [Streptomyces sp. F-1]SFY52379.1 hypothetical protein STEPF1_05651 [Streptomyces sp. F-1]
MGGGAEGEQGGVVEAVAETLQQAGKGDDLDGYPPGCGVGDRS